MKAKVEKAMKIAVGIVGYSYAIFPTICIPFVIMEEGVTSGTLAKSVVALAVTRILVGKMTALLKAPWGRRKRRRPKWTNGTH